MHNIGGSLDAVEGRFLRTYRKLAALAHSGRSQMVGISGHH
jgi:hypothetical protein